MKKLFLTIAIIVTILSFGGCGSETAHGSIFGIITDRVTGEPMRASGVELFKNDLLIARTVTGNDGQFEFLNLEESDDYHLSVVVSGFRTITFPIQVRAGRISRADMQMEKSTAENMEYIVLQSDGIMVQRNDITSGADWDVANNLCQASRVGGRTGWRLPTQGELNTLFNQRTTIDGFSGATYWSSTPTTWGGFWAQDFSTGNTPGMWEGVTTNRARCVRTLP